MADKKDKIVCFSTSQAQFDELHKIASSKDSMSSLLRQIIQEYLDKLKKLT